MIRRPLFGNLYESMHNFHNDYLFNHLNQFLHINFNSHRNHHIIFQFHQMVNIEDIENGNLFENNNNLSSECESENNESENNEKKIYYLKKFNGVNKIIIHDENNDIYYLTCQRYYFKEQINDNYTLISAVKKNYEGQNWIIKRNLLGLYSIQYYENEYEMKNWKINVQEEKNNKLYLVLKNQNNSLFKFYICENNLFLIQDSLTDYFLYIDKYRIRDKYSFYISLTSDKEKASKFSFSNL